MNSGDQRNVEGIEGGKGMKISVTADVRREADAQQEGGDLRVLSDEMGVVLDLYEGMLYIYIYIVGL